mmetsp:Transcript_75008/g.243810  ORF Transcript_75008/g.243810 Transcript_75008/m.243810 type:complete len:206 (-) Transcript_75008:691-1308(-)
MPSRRCCGICSASWTFGKRVGAVMVSVVADLVETSGWQRVRPRAGPRGRRYPRAKARGARVLALVVPRPLQYRHRPRRTRGAAGVSAVPHHGLPSCGWPAVYLAAVARQATSRARASDQCGREHLGLLERGRGLRSVEQIEASGSRVVEVEGPAAGLAALPAVGGWSHGSSFGAPSSVARFGTRLGPRAALLPRRCQRRPRGGRG